MSIATVSAHADPIQDFTLRTKPAKTTQSKRRSQAVTEMSPEVREIMSAYDRLPRELKSNFNSQKSRARKRLGIEDDAEESLAVLEAWSVFSKSEKYAEWQAAQAGEPVPGIGKLLNLPERSGASAGDPMTDITDSEALEETSRASGAAGFSRGSTPGAGDEEPAPPSQETATTIPASEPVKVSVAERSLRQKAQSWLDALVSLHSARYGLIKLVCYAALIPASSQSVLAFFNGLNLYGCRLPRNRHLHARLSGSPARLASVLARVVFDPGIARRHRR
jgi:hypothetical protein